MNWLTFQIIPFIYSQICITADISGSELIVRDCGTLEVATFKLAENSVNVYWCPLKAEVNFDVNRSLSKISFIFRRYLSTIITIFYMLNSLSICLRVPYTCSLDSEVHPLVCDTSLLDTSNITATIYIFMFLLFVIIFLPEV